MIKNLNKTSEKGLEVEVRCDCGFSNIISLKTGIKYYKCGGCNTYYEVDTNIERGNKLK